MQTFRSDDLKPATCFDLVLRDARLSNGQHVDIALAGETIAAIGDVDGIARRELSLGGRVVLPGFVEAHTHLDKAMTVGYARNTSGTLLEAIEVMHQMQRGFTVASVLERARTVARRFVAAGTTTLRTHVDVTPALKLVAVEALLQLREELRPLLDIQIVVLASPLSGGAGAANLAMVKEALTMGVDAVGGCPILDGDFKTHIDIVFELAEKHGLHVDLHVDESDNPEDFSLPYLAERTRVLGFQGRVVAGHCCSLAAVDADCARRTIDAVLEAGISVVTLPSANMYLQGRTDRGLVRRGVTSVRALLDAGVPVCCGTDNIQDPFNPFGRGDPLLAANLLAHVAHLGSPPEQLAAIDAITTVPAASLGLRRFGLSQGACADLVVLDSTEPATILADLPPRRYVIKRGAIVAETRTETFHPLDERSDGI
jgi:cytosine deaminase